VGSCAARSGRSTCLWRGISYTRQSKTRALCIFLGNYFPLPNFKQQLGLRAISRKGEWDISWEYDRRRLFPQLFRVLASFDDRFYDSIRTGRTCFLVLLVKTARNFSDLNRDLLRSNSQNPELALAVRRSSCLAVSIFNVTCWSISEIPKRDQWSCGHIFPHVLCDFSLAGLYYTAKLGINGSLPKSFFFIIVSGKSLCCNHKWDDKSEN